MIDMSREEAQRRLLDRAITTLVCALAFDEALKSGQAEPAELDELRAYWVPDAEQIVDDAERLGLLGDDDDE